VVVFVVVVAGLFIVVLSLLTVCELLRKFSMIVLFMDSVGVRLVKAGLSFTPLSVVVEFVVVVVDVMAWAEV
jgi:hypothetical protein